MVEVYILTTNGLTKDSKAMKILKDSGIIDGIELSNIDDTVERVKDAELKVCMHTPGFNLTINLADPNYMAAFEGNQGERLLKVIRESESPTVVLHLGYSAEQVYKMIAYPNVPKNNVIFTDREQLLERIVENLVAFERKVNEGISEEQQKQIVLQTLDYSREKPIQWDIQLEEAKANRDDIEATVKRYGINAGLLYVTDPDFVKDVLDMAKTKNIKQIGFSFDIAHVFISGDAKIAENKFSGKIVDHVQEMIDATAGRIYQMCLTVPDGNEKTGYADHHRPLVHGMLVSDMIMELGKMVFYRSKDHGLRVLTFGMRTSLSPTEYANKMIEQAEYLKRELSF